MARKHSRRNSRKYRGGNSLPVFAPKNLSAIRKPMINISKPSLPKPSIQLPPMTSNMAVIEHNQPTTMYDVSGNKSTIEHIGDSLTHFASHPQVVGAKNALFGAMSNLMSPAKKATTPVTSMAGGKKKSRRNVHKKRKHVKSRRTRRRRR